MKIGWNRALKLTAYLLCTCLLVFNSINIAIGALGLRQQLSWMPVALTQVTSDSMIPLFETGDMLILVETPYEELAVGDIVTFHQGDQLVTHQITATSGSQFVTQGIANNREDTTLMGRADYCATMAFVVPEFGSVLDFFSGAWEIGCMMTFVVVALYGKILLEWLVAKKSEDSATCIYKAGQMKSKLRLLLTLTFLSVILLTPSLTAAKYVAQINEYTMLSAGSLNFNSNFLSADGNSYSINGWQGGAYTFNLQIRGYSNDLLYNTKDQDVEYGLYIIPILETTDALGETVTATYGQYDTDYKLSVSYSQSPLADDVSTYTFPSDVNSSLCYGPFYLAGDDENKPSHDFDITVTGDDSLSVGTQIRFQIWATTSRVGQFYMEQMGDFQFTKADSGDFISQASKDITGSLITYTIKTDALEQGVTSKDVIFVWNTDKLYLNEFETSAYQIIVNQNSEDPDFDKSEGWLRVEMKDYASVALQFFIRGDYTADDILDSDLYYYVSGEDIPTFDTDDSTDDIDNTGSGEENTGTTGSSADEADNSGSSAT